MTYWIRIAFIVAAVYDGALGLTFLFFARGIFDMNEVPPPNHMGYIQFPAILLIVFAVMFLQVAVRPAQNRSLMLYGAALKGAYCGVAFWHHVSTGIPGLWIPWAWADVVFFFVFCACWLLTRTEDPRLQN